MQFCMAHKTLQPHISHMRKITCLPHVPRPSAARSPVVSRASPGRLPPLARSSAVCRTSPGRLPHVPRPSAARSSAARSPAVCRRWHVPRPSAARPPAVCRTSPGRLPHVRRSSVARSPVVPRTCLKFWSNFWSLKLAPWPVLLAPAPHLVCYPVPHRESVLP